ncbi:hypothetical protein DSM3645_28597 [Blastopirellula marina DSM 3645]|uniref:Polysaccharide pyruvyl transferase domain-containing protein n=1 Tax=Blastopirellula marina DSM 3645 TaxID=314230 RepID=A3ZPE1_9BACT|nr:hypothetical protein DSM3645_28597 [Blastopirellula marina DSM 3645]
MAHAPRWEPSQLLDRESSGRQIAHVAAFTAQGSNAGDILLPAVLRDAITFYGGGIDWKAIHARSAVDESTIDEINSTQGLIIGGGGLFLRDTNANQISGWQWPCSVEQIKRIRVPFCAMGVGYNRFRGQADFDPVFTDNIRVFVERAQFVGLRNTGSMNSIRSYLPTELHSKIRFQPCLTTLIAKLYPHLILRESESSFLALNCAFDRPELRYGNDKESILKSISQGVKTVADRFGLSIKYYSHYSADEEMIPVLRSQGIDCEVVDLSKFDSREIIAAYSEPALAIGMRGHSQMIPFGCNTPILSLISHDKLQWFLDDINRSEWGVDLHQANIAEQIIERGSQILSAPSIVAEFLEESQSSLWEVARGSITEFLGCMPIAKELGSCHLQEKNNESV